MHFLVMVIGVNVEAQLEPYQENNLATCPQAYLQFNDVEDEFREHFQKEYRDTPLVGEQDHRSVQHHRKERFPTFDHYMAQVYGVRDEQTGRYGDWWNPNAEYDWYEIGGRWSGHMVLRPLPTTTGPAPAGGGCLHRQRRASQALIQDIDFEAMSRERYDRFIAAWTDLARTGLTADRRAKGDCGIPETITSLEQLAAYARERSRHCAPAAVVFNGQWFRPEWVENEVTEAAAAQWDTWFSTLLASLPDDTLLTVVDCHT